jgi:uncharacterized membrane protein YczE
MAGVGGPWVPGRDLAPRITYFLAGITISTLTYGLTLKADLGLGPLFVIQDGLHQRLGISIGTAVTWTGVAFILLACLFRSWPGPGTVIGPFISGPLLDWMLPHLPDLHGLVLRLVVCTLAIWVMALGGALGIKARLGIAGLDALMLGIHRVTHVPVARVRLALEASMLVVGWLLGGSVGIGTVICGLLIGHGIQFWLRVLRERPLSVVAEPA